MTLQLREGGYYKTRDGRKVGPAHSADRKYKGQDAFEVDGQHASIHLADGTYAARNCPDLDLIAEWTEGPVRTVTRTVTETTIEAGTYGRVEVLRREGNLAVIGLVKNSISKADSWTGLTSTELKAVAAVLLELAGALE